MMLLAIGAGAILATLGLWMFGVLYVNDFSVPARQLGHFKRALVIFPHPDDETNVAGTIWRLARNGCAVTLAVLTEGECGTPDAHFEQDLATQRRAEMRQAAKALGDVELIQEDFGDSRLATRTSRLKPYLDGLLAREQPDLVISYDLAGLYGHPDHVACAQIIADLLAQKYPGVSLWHTAWPKRLLAMAKLPEHMARGPDFRSKRANPNARVFVGLGLIAQIRAIYAHKSQRQSFASSVPYHLPLWFVQSLKVYEYFEQVR